jgi:hypothetical protein
MDDKKKIVLGSKDILSKGVVDIFLNINLQQTFNQIKKDKYDNNFDVAEQFRKERNASRDFRIYGIVDSTAIDTDNLTIEIYKDAALSQFFGNITTTPLVYSEENVFAKKRGKYLLELNNYDSDVVYFRVLGDNVTYGNQVFEQRVVFYNLQGEFVEYGTQTVDIGLDSEGFIEIENDFPFFYNKHWIKRDFEILEEKPTVMQFGSETSSVAEGESVSFEITMDKPSPFGNELVVLDAILGTVVPADFSLSISGSTVVFPITLNWSQGEQNKTLTFDAIEDDIHEFSETIQFQLYNFQFTNSGLTTSHYTTIEDTTPRKKTIYNLGEVYRNRAVFTGRTYEFSTQAPSTTSAYAILRNGLKFTNSNEEFYPGDTYKLFVTNNGIDTILPINNYFGIDSEQLWLAGEVKTFNIDTKYSGSEKHKVKMIFPQGVPQNVGSVRINGVRIPLNFSYLNYAEVSKKTLDSSALDYLPSVGMEKDWSAVGDGISAITFTSKTTGIPVKIDIIETATSFGFPTPGAPNPAATPQIIEISPFVERAQLKPQLTLLANDSNNSTTNYEFQLAKQGYATVSVLAEPQFASISGTNRYLITDFKYVCRNWDDTNNDCIYSTKAVKNPGAIVTVNGGLPNQNNYFHPVGGAYINGFVFLATNTLPESKLNLTQFNSAFFRENPLVVNPCTNDLILQNSISQLTKLTIPNVGQTNEIYRALYEDNSRDFRSFDFRTGTTGPFTTFYKENTGFYTNSVMGWNKLVNASGATNGSSVTIGKRLDYGNIIYSIPVGPLLGLDENNQPLSPGSSDVDIYLESKIPGVPFQIQNIVNAYVQTTATATYFINTLTITAGTIIGEITTETIRPNGVGGVDLNPANNWMGGYNVDLVI